MAVLAVGEYQQIICGDRFEPKTRTITPSQHSVLERFSEEYKKKFKVEVFKHGPRRSLIAQNFVGIINLGADQIEILPKIEGETSDVRKNLAKMIASVLSLDLHVGGASLVGKTNDSILEILIQLFCEKLWQAVRRGMVRRYESRQENLGVLRGRLKVAAQIRSNLARPDKLACEFDEFNENNPLNQAIRTALQVLLRVSRSQSNQRNIAELLFCFQDVDTVAPTAIKWHLVSTDRLSVRYEPILTMARLFIEGCSPDVVTGNGDGFALLFDMSELFESYIGAIVRRVFSMREISVQLQGPKRHLAKHSSGVPVFELRPDIVVSRVGITESIIDTKWKRLKEAANREGVGTADIYQMYAYSTRYLSADVVLLYPHHSELGEWRPRRAEYWLDDVHVVSGGKRRIAVSTVDLRDLNDVPSQLRRIFPDFLNNESFVSQS